MSDDPSWKNRVWQEFRAGNLTLHYARVLTKLRLFRGHGGLICPSHETLAERAGCSERTVRRALSAGRELGLVAWAERRVRAGWRWLRTSNRYWLTLPREAVQARPKRHWPRRATSGQTGRGEESASKKEALREMLRAAAGLPDLLAARREAFPALLAARNRRV